MAQEKVDLKENLQIISIYDGELVQDNELIDA